jgi:hypothetical protein
MYIAGMNIYNRSLFTKAEMLKGKIPPPGTRAATVVGNQTKEFVSVKFASGNIVNGSVLALPTNPEGTAVLSTAPPKASTDFPAVGVLVCASATATITMAGTTFAWAQIYGQCLVRASSTGVDSVGMLLTPGAVPGVALLQVEGTASLMLRGMAAIGTGAAVGLISVMLNYPRFVKEDQLA